MATSDGPIIIHTDGACEGNPGPGGWAAVLRFGARVQEIGGGVPASTNNRMELRAAIEALRQLQRPVIVDLYTDSTYVRSGITEWLPGWKARQWRTSAKKPVKNAELWRELDSLTMGHTIRWRWVRGHAGNRDNERCDFLANEHVRRIKAAYTRPDLRRMLAEFQASMGEQATLPGA